MYSQYCIILQNYAKMIKTYQNYAKLSCFECTQWAENSYANGKDLELTTQ